MQCLIYFFILAFSFSTYAAKDQRALLKCLAQEEKKFHLTKYKGPLYELNQRLISEIIQIPQAELTSDDFKQICSASSRSPSLKLLELTITRKNKIFHLPDTTTNGQRSVSLGMIDDFIESSREIFLNFIAQIQANAPSPTCLKEEIPQLDLFFTEIKYLQEDVDIEKIFRGREKVIFKKLKNYPQAFERCRERVKKKLKSESKGAKKS
jgi:hypothetical protein